MRVVVLNKSACRGPDVNKHRLSVAFEFDPHPLARPLSSTTPPPKEQSSRDSLDGHQLKAKFASLGSKPRFLAFAEASLLFDKILSS